MDRPRIFLDTDEETKSAIDTIPKGTRALVLNGVLRALVKFLNETGWRYMDKIIAGKIRIEVIE